MTATLHNPEAEGPGEQERAADTGRSRVRLEESSPLYGAYLVVGMFSLIAIVLSAVALFFVANRTSATSSAPATEAAVSLQEFSITGELVVPPGRVTLAIENDGSMAHNLIFERDGRPAARTADLLPGSSERLDLGDLPEGEYVLFCDISGHRAGGMEALLIVSSTAEHSSAAGGHGEADFAAMDAAMIESMLAFPAATEGKGNLPLAPTILEDGTKEFELTAAITPWEVEPGKFVDAWTYNGQVPGPQIRVDLGDTVRVVVQNDLPMGTDVHWHGIHTPNSMDGVAPLTQDLILSGESFVYEFIAEDTAIGMYHAHHHGQMQVTNGMFGSFIIGESPIPRGMTISGVEIPADLEIAEEIPMVLNDAGVIGLSLNGKSFPATEPVALEAGDWMVVHYYNEGLQIHPMHLHQFPQLIFAKDGIPLDNPYWADTINVAPGERYSVLFHAEDPGTWVWHCHILTHVEREEGMFGMVTAIVVTEPDAT